MTYSDSVLDLETLSRQDVLRLLQEHYADLTEFDRDFGKVCEQYDAEDVMAWLGY